MTETCRTQRLTYHRHFFAAAASSVKHQLHALILIQPHRTASLAAARSFKAAPYYCHPPHRHRSSSRSSSSSERKQPVPLSDDPRLGDVVEQLRGPERLASGAGAADIALVGFPYDEGTARNGGRSGGKAAPATVRSVRSAPLLPA